jgi:hypothetical protein
LGFWACNAGRFGLACRDGETWSDETQVSGQLDEADPLPAFPTGLGNNPAQEFRGRCALPHMCWPRDESGESETPDPERQPVVPCPPPQDFVGQ